MVIFLEHYLNLPIINPIIDYWSFVHIITGILFGIFLVRAKNGWLIALISFAAYEMIENNLLGAIFIKELLANSLADIVIAMIGFFIARYYVSTMDIPYIDLQGCCSKEENSRDLTCEKDER